MTAIKPARSGLGIGLHALGIGNGSKPDVLASVARRADEVGFATLWCGEHVVMVDEPASRYPYSGVTELVIVGAPPAEPDEAADWVSGLAAQWLDR
jgi:alkanesulfonate monooxygenase SsuD/methylene tetrahydromethanopterin reductase-like flavin-dependent oxidoreductase (luciferase family)